MREERRHGISKSVPSFQLGSPGSVMITPWVYIVRLGLFSKRVEPRWIMESSLEYLPSYLEHAGVNGQPTSPRKSGLLPSRR